jgi:MFS family permease
VNGGLVAAYLGSTALGVGVGASKTFIPALMVEAGIERVAPYFAAFTLGAVVQRLAFGWVPDRIGHRQASGLSLVVYGVAMLAVLAIAPSWVHWLSVVIGLAHGMSYPAIGALAVSLGDDAARGRITAWMTGGFNLGFALSTAGLAPLEGAVGYSGLVAIGGIAVLLVGLLLPTLVARYQAKQPDVPTALAVAPR